MRDERIQFLERSVLLISGQRDALLRLHNDNYIPDDAQSDDVCEHGFNRVIPCRKCDLAVVQELNLSK